MKCCLFAQTASFHGPRQRKWWTISHHLRLWDHMYSRLQILLPDGEEELFLHTCSRMYVCLEVQLDTNYTSMWGECISLQGYNQWNNDVVEQWNGNHSRQSYSYLIQRRTITSFIWTFQRTQEASAVRPGHAPWTSLMGEHRTRQCRGEKRRAGRVEWVEMSGEICDRKSSKSERQGCKRAVRPAMMSGLETAALSERQAAELEVAELKMLRVSLGVTRMGRIRSEHIWGTAQALVRQARLMWYGTVQSRDMLDKRCWGWSCQAGRKEENQRDSVSVKTPQELHLHGRVVLTPQPLRSYAFDATQLLSHMFYIASIRRENTAVMLQRSTPSISPMWLMAWPHSVAAVPWALLRLALPVFPAHLGTSWSMGQESVRAALQTPSSRLTSLLERMLVSHVDRTQSETR